MFIKERFPPLALLTADACISRLPKGHPKLNLLRQKAARLQKGYNGERKLDYYLKSLDKDFSILNDVTLSIFDKQFQMDSLIITATAIYIIEVKSLDGTVTFHTGLKQLTQSTGEKLVGMKYPITQAESISFHLLRWLEHKKLGGLPIYYFIAIAEQSTIIQVDGTEDLIAKVVSYADEIPNRLMKTNNKLLESRVENNSLRNKIVQSVLQNCEELRIDIIEKLGLDINDILPGVHCPSCNRLGMLRLRYRWQCPACKIFSRSAHKKALKDFALIFGKEITNRQCQEFLGSKPSGSHSILKGTKGIKLSSNKRKWLLEVRELGK